MGVQWSLNRDIYQQYLLAMGDNRLVVTSTAGKDLKKYLHKVTWYHPIHRGLIITKTTSKPYQTTIHTLQSNLEYGWITCKHKTRAATICAIEGDVCFSLVLNTATGVLPVFPTQSLPIAVIDYGYLYKMHSVLNTNVLKEESSAFRL